ncbi:MAG TPA: 5-methyltetrahydropteroyltriglutamate--homocysteine S-methyltransferase [Lactobacillaceae bacterium]|jgi:methionine synthase II (cobalamin-independent)
MTTALAKQTHTLGHQHVGSFLRPDKLKQARAQFEAGDISAADLKNVEDDAIRTLVAQQKAAGLDVVTDGEFRRSYWHLDFFWGFEGVAHEHYGEGYQFAHEETRDDTAILRGKFTFDPATHPFVEHFKFLKAVADEAGVDAKITIPAPAQLLLELERGTNAETIQAFYNSREALFADIITGYRAAIEALYAAGARTVQLDDCTWGTLVDPKIQVIFANIGLDIEQVKQDFLALNNGVLTEWPEDLTFNTHVCRGNYHSDWAAEGGYESVADALFGQEQVNAYFLEFDSERAGGFEPLAKVSGDKKVVLGLVTSKSGELEDKQVIIDRIQEAAQYLPLERLWLSTQCGFASTEEGNILTEAQQWAKIKLVNDVIAEVWGE